MADLAKQLATQNRAVTSQLNATRDQIRVLTTRLDAMGSERSTEKSAPHSAIYRKPMTAASMHHRIDDTRTGAPRSKPLSPVAQRNFWELSVSTLVAHESTIASLSLDPASLLSVV